MAECYPTGCTPCTDEIQFPENPVDGQEFCFSIGTDDAGEPIQRCWVYDHCVPGWRAKGETAATVEFKGVVNVCTQNPPTDAESGDWWIVTEDCNNQQQLDEWFGDNHPAQVREGDRIAYSGTEWQVVPPAILAYASDALGDVPLVTDPDADDFGKPDPDDRRGGIVKIASLSQAKAGTDKCDVITPYTLQGVFDEKVPQIDNDTCPVTVDDEGPEAVAYVPQGNRIACKTLTEGTTNFFGVGQIATNFSNDRDTYGDGWDTDWLTNAAMAPIIDGIIRRLEEIEQGGGGGQPVANVVRTFTSSGTWTPVDAANLVSIKVVLGGGAGGAASPRSPQFQAGADFGSNAVIAGTFNTAYPGENTKFYEKNLTVAESGTSAAVVVGAGGSGDVKSSENVPMPVCNGAGGDSSFTGTGSESAIVAGGMGTPAGPGNDFGACPAIATRPNSNVGDEVTALFPTRLGGKTYYVNQTGTSAQYEWNMGGAGGASGLVLVYEYYPSDWVDPRSGGFNL
jgi:hypothetical protein